MSSCDRCGADVNPRSAFHYDDKAACRTHLLEFRNMGTIEVVRGAEREFIYSATQSELERLVADHSIDDLVARSFEWVAKPTMISRPLQVSKAYNRRPRWITLKK